MKLNKKGMTLFELLAVIVILGIVAAIAFPTVNGLINNTKKDAVVGNANSFVSSAVTNAQSDYLANGHSGAKTYFVYVGVTTATVDAATADVKLDLNDDFNSTDITAFVTVSIADDGTTITTTNVSYTENGFVVTNSVASGFKTLVRNEAAKATNG